MIRPLADYVLIEPRVVEDKTTSSGIVLPKTVQDKPCEGKVIAVGKYCTVKVGDTILYKKWGGNEIKPDGKDMLLVLEEDILAVVKEDK